jgi:hypothetical protein
MIALPWPSATITVELYYTHSSRKAWTSVRQFRTIADRLDVLINNAGVYPDQRIGKFKLQEVFLVMDRKIFFLDQVPLRLEPRRDLQHPPKCVSICGK